MNTTFNRTEQIALNWEWHFCHRVKKIALNWR